MNALRTAAVTVAVLSLVAVVGYGLFGIILISFDESAYTANTTTAYDYNAVLVNAEAAGYGVRTVDSSGYHPEGVDDLDASLGDDYELTRVVYTDHNDSELWITVYDEASGTTELAFYTAAPGPATHDELNETWLINHLTVAFGIDEATAAGYVDELQSRINDGESPTVEVPDHDLQFAAVYERFEADGDPTVRTELPGQGGLQYLYNDTTSDQRGRLHFVVGRAEITAREDGHRYTLNVDRLGGIGVTVRDRANQEIPDAELRADVRALFERVGLPPEAADDLSFQYDGSVW
jgi:hypothetical protein